jgi:hypothetical protein
MIAILKYISLTVFDQTFFEKVCVEPVDQNRCAGLSRRSEGVFDQTFSQKVCDQAFSKKSLLLAEFYKVTYLKDS